MKLNYYILGMLSMGALLGACSDDDESLAPTVQYIELSETQKTIFVGDAWQISAKVTPENAVNKKVQWSNLYPEVATIDAEGNVKALVQGTDSIFATVDNVKALCILKVKNVAVESITLNEKSKELAVGQTLQLSATIAPENATVKDITWESSEPEVAEVDEKGKVTALAAGNAVITASCGGAKATCELLVYKDELTLSLDETILEVKGTQELEVAVPPYLEAETAVWISLNEKVVKVTANAEDSKKATLEAVGSGSVKVQVTVGKLTATCKVTVKEEPIVGNMELSATKMSLELNFSQELSVSVPEALEGQPVKWTAVDPAVVSVAPNVTDDKKAVVTGLKAGNTEIQVTVGSLTAACAVTVTKSPVYVEGTTATFRLNLMADEAAVASKINELDAQGVTTYKLIGDYKKLGKMNKDENVFATTKVEVLDMSAIDANTLPKVELEDGSKLPGIATRAFDCGGGNTPVVNHFANLKTVILPEGLKVLGMYAFEGTKIENFVAPDVTVISASAFAYCTHLSNVKFTTPEKLSLLKNSFGKAVSNSTLYLHENNKNLVEADGKTVVGREWKEVVFVK